MKHIIILFFSLLGIAMCDAQEKLLKTADDGFQWYLIKYDNRIYGAQDLSGKDLIASNRGYTDIILIDHFFHVFKGMSQQYCSGDNGICDITGKEIISPNRGYSEIVFHKEDEKFGYFSVKKGNMKGICDMTGKEIVPCNYTNIIYHPYDKVLMYENYDGKYVSLNIGLDDRTKGDFYLASAIPIHTMSYSATNAPSYNSGTNQVSNSGNGTNSEHGKIINQTSEKEGTLVVRKEWYEDGYYSIFLMDKCKACGGTGRVGYNFCTAGCAMGYLTLLTYYDPNGNEVERSGNMGSQYNSYYGGNSGGTYSGGNTGSGSRNGGGSVYTKCTSCNGTGRCSSCNGRGYKFNSYSGHDDSCPSCRGKGSCPICYGRGKL